VATKKTAKKSSAKTAMKKSPARKVEDERYPRVRAILNASTRGLTSADEAKFSEYFDRFGDMTEAGKQAIEEIITTTQEHGPELNRVSQELLVQLIPSLDLPDDQRSKLTAYCISLIDRAGTLLDRSSLALSMLAYQRLGQSTFSARKNAAKRQRTDPKAQAMAEIRSEWEKAGRPGAVFARQMHARFSDVIASEGSIRNAMSKWRRGESSS